jgi:hypothetical protein
MKWRNKGSQDMVDEFMGNTWPIYFDLKPYPVCILPMVTISIEVTPCRISIGSLFLLALFCFYARKQ